jgi:hypothetical protein
MEVEVVMKIMTAFSVVLFWSVAAILVTIVHATIDPRSASTGAIVTMGVVVGTAYAYTRLCARRTDITHALGVGIAWLLLTIATEMALSAYVGHDWFALLGSPDRPLLRNAFLFVWIFAPALTA